MGSKVTRGRILVGLSRRGPREVALRVLWEVETRGRYCISALDRALSENPLSVSERALCTQLVYGTLRWRGRLDHVLAHLSRHPPARLPPWIRNCLRLGSYQLLFLQGVPPQVAVSASVELARRFGHAGTISLVNAVLRRVASEGDRVPFPALASDPVGHLVLALSHPEWLVRRWIGRFGVDEARLLCEADNRNPRPTLRANLLRNSPEELERILRSFEIAASRCRFALEGLQIENEPGLRESAPYQAGGFTVQGEGSMLVGRLAAPRPRWRVVDLCAGAGGKATHLAEQMENQGFLLACDPKGEKLKTLRDNCRRLGISILKTREADARFLPSTRDFDLCLVDVPCSGTGTLCRRSDLRWRLKPEDLPSLVQLQRELLEAAAGLLRPGGILVYSTCSLEPEENQGAVSSFLGLHPDFAPEDCRPYLPGLPPEAFQADGAAVQLLPHREGTDGMFLARLRREPRAILDSPGAEN